MEPLSKDVHLLIAPKNIPIKRIHQTTFLIRKIFGKDLNDIVPAYHSIAVFIEKPLSDVMEILEKSALSKGDFITNRDPLQIPICYELGLDLEDISRNAGISKKELIAIHLEGNYSSLFIGFMPGFVYADGLDERLYCPRKESPRKQVEAGSIGIGGSQTGIYSLASPGGWNILGRTPLLLFDPKKNQPMLIEVGTPFRFYRITKEEFETWGN